MSDRDDFLLHVISASREIKWRAFADAFDILYQNSVGPSSGMIGQIGYERRRTARVLDALGHCDAIYSESGGSLYIAPPVLARLPYLGFPQAVLCGARGPDTVVAIKRAREGLGKRFDYEVDSQSTKNPCIPQRIWIEGESATVLEGLSRYLGISYADIPISCGLLDFAGNLQEYLDSCDWSTGGDINWPRHDFDIERLQFKTRYVSLNAMRLSRYDNPITTIPRIYLWKNDSKAQVDVDWGRYAVLSHHGSNVIIYDSRQMLLAVPAGVPLPKLLARAVVLCSGYASRFVPRQEFRIESPEQRGFDVFCGVPSSIAHTVSLKLGQSLAETQFDIAFEEIA
jgi:hypothetical protein